MNDVVDEKMEQFKYFNLRDEQNNANRPPPIQTKEYARRKSEKFSAENSKISPTKVSQAQTPTVRSKYDTMDDNIISEQFSDEDSSSDLEASDINDSDSSKKNGNSISPSQSSLAKRGRPSSISPSSHSG